MTDVAADGTIRGQVFTDSRLDFPWNYKHGPTVREVVVAELDRLAALAAQAEEAQADAEVRKRLYEASVTERVRLEAEAARWEKAAEQLSLDRSAAEARAVAAEKERDEAKESLDAAVMTREAGNEILGEIVQQIEAVSPMPDDQPCKCGPCRHSRGVTRVIGELDAARAQVAALADDEAVMRGVSAVRRMGMLRVGDMHDHAEAFRVALVARKETSE